MLNNKGRIPCGRDVSPRDEAAFEGDSRLALRCVCIFFSISFEILLLKCIPRSDMNPKLTLADWKQIWSPSVLPIIPSRCKHVWIDKSLHMWDAKTLITSESHVP